MRPIHDPGVPRGARRTRSFARGPWNRTIAIVALLTLTAAIPPAFSSSLPLEQRPNVERILHDGRYRWVTIRSPHARIHFPAGSFAAGRRDDLASRVEAARSAVLDKLGIETFPDTLDVFYVDSRQDMGNLVGNPVTGFAYYQEDAVVLVCNETWRAFERHELTHVVTFATWNDAAGPASVEGLATFVDGDCGGYGIGSMTRTILDDGELLDLRTLTQDFRNQSDLIAYLQAAATIEFVRERKGPAILRTLWSRGLQAAPELLGLSEEAFDAQFRDWLGTRFEPVPDSAWQEIQSHGCGITLRAKEGRTGGSEQR